MLAVANSFLLPALLPISLFENIGNGKVNEKSMLAVATLVSNIVIGAIKAWEKGEVKKLDPNPGDKACQIRGFLLYLFFSDEALNKEALRLKEKMDQIKEVVNRRNTELCSKKGLSSQMSSGSFFKEQLGDVLLTKKMEFLLQCYLLAVTRAPFQRLENGIVLTQSNVSLLAKLSPRIADLAVEARRKIVETAQLNISANSVELLRIEAEKLTYFGPEEKKHLLNMLSCEMTHVYTPDPQYEPKTFGCIFYEYKAILYRLREENGLVCFKSIVPPGGTPFRILLQPKQIGAEFSLLPDDAYGELSPQLPVVVFEGVVNGKYDKKGFAEKITEIGFTDLIQVAAAIEPPYEGSSTLAHVNNNEAQGEILRYRTLANKINCQKEAIDPLLILDHVYCNLLAAERGGKVSN